MSLFDFSNYREIISSEISLNAHIRGYKKKMSEAGGFHAAYLSQVLTGAANLTTDQASLLCEFWNFDERMSEFFICLVGLEKATVESLKQRIQYRITELRTVVSLPERSLKPDQVMDYKHAQTVFSSCDYYAVVAAIKMPQLRSETAIADFLRIHIENLKTILRQLNEMNIIERSGDYWRPHPESHAMLANNKSFTHDLVGSLHSKFSQEYVNTYHSVCYSAVIPITLENYNAFKEDMRSLMQKYHGISEDKGEVVAGITMSLFRF